MLLRFGRFGAAHLVRLRGGQEADRFLDGPVVRYEIVCQPVQELGVGGGLA